MVYRRRNGVGPRVLRGLSGIYRGGFLTVMAILLALVAIEDVLKPYGQQEPTIPASFLPRIHPGIVVLGVRYTWSGAARQPIEESRKWQ
jgi:hypothetical protein